MLEVVERKSKISPFRRETPIPEYDHLHLLTRYSLGTASISLIQQSSSSQVPSSTLCAHSCCFDLR
ncbi:hypothetical protein Bca52824_008696 [Brassica carinata]|uniref:Uncharacterized protein n=1 Tax=Brassica carinata TaxID=52824 RepID=A0A8X7W8J1_BRACI|nr:hypothetical protein Bca52824_008696 [Brassica carinata]